MEFITTSSFVIILIVMISLPTVSIMAFLWWCVHEARLKTENKIKIYHNETIKIMSDFQDIQKEFLAITKSVEALSTRLERLEKR